MEKVSGAWKRHLPPDKKRLQSSGMATKNTKSTRPAVRYVGAGKPLDANIYLARHAPVVLALMAGKTLKQVKAIHGLSYPTTSRIRRTMADAGMSVPDKLCRTKQTRAEFLAKHFKAVQWLDKGKAPLWVADKVGASASTIYKIQSALRASGKDAQ